MVHKSTEYKHLKSKGEREMNAQRQTFDCSLKALWPYNRRYHNRSAKVIHIQFIHVYIIIYIYKMTKVVRALWLAERRVSMSMQTWLWRQNVLLFAPDYASTNLKKFWVENLTHLLYQFTHSFVGWNLENHRKHAVSIFFLLTLTF